VDTVIRGDNWLTRNYHIIILIIFTIIGFLLRFNNLQNYSFWNDEIISIKASEGILNQGFPVMLDGTIYFKSPLYTYSLALSMHSLGVTEFSTRIISVIFGTLTIILIYFISYKISGNNKLVGLSTALIYSLSLWSIAWAREARFYQMYQFFSLLTIYLFWLGFIDNDSKVISSKLISWGNFKKYRFLILSIIIFIFTMLCSKLAIILIPPLIFSVAIIKGKKALLNYAFIISILIMIFIWIFYQSMPLIFSFETKNPLIESNLIGFDTDSVLKNFIGYGYLLFINFILSIFVITGIFLKRFRMERSFWFLYSYLVVSSGILLVFTTTPIFRSRYHYFLFPILIITACISAFYISSEIIRLIKNKRLKNEYSTSNPSNIPSESKKYLFKNIALNKIHIFIILVLIILLADPRIYYIHRISTDPYSGTQLPLGDVPWHADYRGGCEYLRDNYQSGDCIIVKRDRVVDFYLNDYFNDNLENDSYLVITYSDLNLSEIQTFFNDYRVWVFLDIPIDNLIPRFLSQEEYDFIVSNTKISFLSEDQHTIVRLENKLISN
jgi:hypothetical protein